MSERPAFDLKVSVWPAAEIESAVTVPSSFPAPWMTSEPFALTDAVEPSSSEPTVRPLPSTPLRVPDAFAAPVTDSAVMEPALWSISLMDFATSMAVEPFCVTLASTFPAVSTLPPVCVKSEPEMPPEALTSPPAIVTLSPKTTLAALRADPAPVSPTNVIVAPLSEEERLNVAPADIPDVAMTVAPSAAPETDVPIRMVNSDPLAPLAVTAAFTSDALRSLSKLRLPIAAATRPFTLTLASEPNRIPLGLRM